MFYLHQTLKLEYLQKPYQYFTRSGQWFTFPDTLGAVFFGVSLAVFYLTIKRIAWSEVSRTRKTLSILALGLLFTFGALDRAFAIDRVRLSIDSWSGYKDNTKYVSIYTSDDPGYFVEKLHGFVVIFTGWIAAHVLAARAYILTGRVRRLGILFAFLLFSMFVVQLVLFAIGFQSAFPSYPIINLVLQIPVILAVIFHAFKNTREHKSSALYIIEDILIDSGALLTVGLILQTIFPFAGVSFRPMDSLLPHLHNITVCTVLVRLLEGLGVDGEIRLTDEASPITAHSSPA